MDIGDLAASVNDPTQLGALFLARVISVDTTNYQVNLQPVAYRMPIRGAKVVSHVASVVNNQFRGFVWLPSVGDIVVCAFLEGYSNGAIVLGSIYIPSNTEIKSTGIPVSPEGRVYTDYLVHHQTGSFLRFRTKDPPVYTQDPDGNTTWKYTTNQRSEIEINHKAGDKFLINETTTGKTEVTYTHNTGAQIKIDTTGNIVLTPASGKVIKLGSGSSTEQVVLGTAFQTWFDATYTTKLNSHTHTTPVGPSGPPLNQPFDQMASQSLLSNKAKTEL